MYTHEDPYLVNLPEEEKWLLIYLRIYAEDQLINKYSPNNDKINQKIEYRICSDKRRYNTVRKHLCNLGVAKIKDYCGDLVPVHEKILEIMGTLAIAPVFDTSGIFKESKVYGTSTIGIPAKNPIHCYPVISHMNCRELMYIFLHQDEYVFAKTVRINKVYKSYFLRVYQKNLIDSLHKNIYRAHAELYGRDHLPSLLNKMYGMNIRALYSDRHYGDWRSSLCHFDKDSEVSEQHLTERLVEITRQVRLLKRACREIYRLREKIRETGQDAYNQCLVKTAVDYILENAPLWINGNDRDEKELATIFLKGLSSITNQEE